MRVACPSRAQLLLETLPRLAPDQRELMRTAVLAFNPYDPERDARDMHVVRGLVTTLESAMRPDRDRLPEVSSAFVVKSAGGTKWEYPLSEWRDQTVEALKKDVRRRVPAH